ncbi:MAG TPA: EVE domain-containing protein [Candidatus Thermoplasmatota archaeon]|nr:EVE domain-containing protein [Candidatus Thermoplasmatota archaeon]
MPRRYWLAKTEPDVYSIDDLAKAPEGTTFWDGVRNHQARNNLRAMAPGDGLLIYHSNAKPSAIVGAAEVAEAATPDPTQFDPKSDHHDPKSKREDPTWWGVRVRLVERFPRPVTLEDAKASKALSSMVLVKNSRLSVQPVSAAEWRAVIAMARRGP